MNAILTVAFSAIFTVVTYVNADWIGWNLIGRPKPDPKNPDPIVLTLVGWYVQALLVLVLAALGAIGPAWLAGWVLVPAGCLFLDRRQFVPSFVESLRPYRFIASTDRILLWFMGFLITVLIILNAAPVLFFDALYYHYGLPDFWLAAGRLVSPGPAIHAYTPLPVEMHILGALGLFGDTMAAFGMLAQVLLAALLVYRILSETSGLDPPWPHLGVLVFLVTPAVWDLLLLHLVDVFALWCGTAFVFLWYGFMHSQQNRITSRFILFSLVTGLVLIAKPAVTLAFAAAGWLSVLYRCRGRIGKPIRTILTGSCLVALPAVPWLIMSQLLSGHALSGVFPYLSRFPIRTTLWRIRLNDAAASFWGSHQPILRDLVQIVSRWFHPHNRATDVGGSFGLLFLTCLPLALMVPRNRRSSFLWIAAFVGWYGTFRLNRYFLFTLALDTVLILSLVSMIFTAKRFLALLACITLIHGTLFLASPTRSAFVRLAVDNILHHDVLSVDRARFIPASTTLCRYANAVLNPKTSRILFVGEFRYHPCRIPFVYQSTAFRQQLETPIRGMSFESAWEQKITSMGITHIIYTPAEVNMSYEWPAHIKLRLHRWIRKQGRILAAQKGSLGPSFLIEISHSDSVRSSKP